jgi:hypothetical protein
MSVFEDPRLALLRFFVLYVAVAEAAVLPEAQLLGRGPLVLGRGVVSPLALRAGQNH